MAKTNLSSKTKERKKIEIDRSSNYILIAHTPASNIIVTVDKVKNRHRPTKFNVFVCVCKFN